MPAPDISRAKNAIRICVDAVGSGTFRGRLYHRYAPTPILFAGAEQLLLAAESLFDTWNYPQPGLLARSFSPRPAKRGNTRMDRQPIERLSEHAGGRATFTVQVTYRQNATWQGTICWKEKRGQVSFRSFLEMLLLMQEAVADSGGWNEELKAASGHAG